MLLVNEWITFSDDAEDADRLREENKGFIDDGDVDDGSSSGYDSSDSGEKRGGKRRREDDDDLDADNLDEDDLDLIEENIGVKINRKVRLLSQWHITWISFVQLYIDCNLNILVCSYVFYVCM